MFTEYQGGNHVIPEEYMSEKLMSTLDLSDDYSYDYDYRADQVSGFVRYFGEFLSEKGISSNNTE